MQHRRLSGTVQPFLKPRTNAMKNTRFEIATTTMILALALLLPGLARAHCDALDGPVEHLDLPVAHAVGPHELVDLDEQVGVVLERVFHTLAGSQLLGEPAWPPDRAEDLGMALGDGRSGSCPVYHGHLIL